MSEREVGVVVVVYHPDETALVHLEHVRAQSTRIVVVDNTPDPDAALHKKFAADGVDVIVNRNDGGLGRAYNRGVTKLVEQGCELVFLLDQDSEIPDDYLARMSEVSAPVAGTSYLIGPRIYEVRAEVFMPDGADPSDTSDGLHRTDQLISSGSAVSAAAFAQLGTFREDFFIEWIDVEYCYRAEHAGVARYVNPGVVLRQYQGRITRHGDRLTTNHVAWRRYYLVRNGVWMARHHPGMPGSLLSTARFALRELMVVLRFEQDKARKVVAVLTGIVDGLRGRLGPLAGNRSRTHRYLAG